ncbi:Zn-dependent peptidase ImmA, M78 family [Parafrankia irregularis]|uniref:Zn-dependent peptidase ImmA, M78 family n=1 Tax=Parafrankia irregularis TaxID=795642 RepID=A0A0S4QZQ3_9ACTN|nr:MULTISPECIES: ImmA/IrrE family metallo-endopeptidase [Parafrankia]MBE3203549.1 ImmA/IrrE family metallo-endopeptidase [Parafrankia sp. CH37]CUU60444.1 Zn-dependent peptidase ImmA, M78 family [Parafrankia irregularis]
MAERVAVSPGLLAWARERSGRTVQDLSRSFPKLIEWEAGVQQPTMRQLEGFARATHTPFGFFFLPEPPVENLPITDFRTIGDEPVIRPTPDLLDIIYACQRRQDWYRAFAEENDHDPVSLVGSMSLDADPRSAASALRDTLGFGLDIRSTFQSWSRALDGLRENAEKAGILVMVNGVVDNNTHRKLDPDEFRGFSLVDEYAPVIFINGSDTKAAQIFTLAHELAHIALGESGVSNPNLGSLEENGAVEIWCNSVAAELLVPTESIVVEFRSTADLTMELDRLAKIYRVSTLVVLRRLHDTRAISPTRFRNAFPVELDRVRRLSPKRDESSGNFYNTEPIRMSKRFTRAILADTVGGRTMYRDTFRLLGFSKISTFEELGQKLGVV